MNTINQEDLERLRGSHMAYSDIRSEIANASIMEHKFRAQKEQYISQLASSESALMEIQSEITQKYNADRINLETGEYTIKNTLQDARLNS